MRSVQDGEPHKRNRIHVVIVGQTSLLLNTKNNPLTILPAIRSRRAPSADSTRRHTNHIDHARFIFEGNEGDAARRVRPLAASDDAGGAHDLAMLGALHLSRGKELHCTEPRPQQRRGWERRVSPSRA